MITLLFWYISGLFDKILLKYKNVLFPLGMIIMSHENDNDTNEDEKA